MGRPVASTQCPAAPNCIGFGTSAIHPNVQAALQGSDNAAANVGAETQQPPPLGILENFENKTFKGFGFNTIFRPHSTNSATPTLFNVPPQGANDNVLQLNHTSEIMEFDKQLGAVPNRGLLDQADIDLNGVPYKQQIFDIMDPKSKKPVLHFENGLWMHVPQSTNPALPVSYARMGSIPHGTTINAQTFSAPVTSQGPPKIDPVNITPFSIGSNPKQFVPFPNQKAELKNTFRIPQDLTPFTNSLAITQEMITDPNVVLRNANKGKDIVESTTYTISTSQGAKKGGATANIGFLVGNSQTGNANATDVTVTYWISKVRTKLHLTPFKPTHEGETKKFSPVAFRDNDAVPEFIVNFVIPREMDVSVEYTQLQYSQNVILDFAPLSWPHVTVSTLAQTGIQLPESILSQ